MAKLRDVYSIAFRYNRGDHLAFQQAIHANPFDKVNKLSYSDYLQDHDLASEEDINRLRNTPGRLRFTTHPDNRVSVHPWLTPKKDFLPVSAKVSDAHNDFEDVANSDSSTPEEFDEAAAKRKAAHDSFANFLASREDPRANIVRRSGSLIDVGRERPLEEARNAPFKTLGEAQALAVHPGNLLNALDYTVHENNRGDGIPLEDGTRLHYELNHHPHSNKTMATVTWDAKNQSYTGVYTPEEAEHLINNIAPEHSAKWKSNLEKVRRSDNT